MDITVAPWAAPTASTIVLGAGLLIVASVAENLVALGLIGDGMTGEPILTWLPLLTVATSTPKGLILPDV